MRRLLLCALLLMSALTVSPVHAWGGAVWYVDDDGVCGGRKPCYPHPQDAVNSAKPGDTIRVYPGTYGSRFTDCSDCYSPNDKVAPALIVYRDRLTIEAVDRNPARTVIEATHDYWSNPIAVQNSTAGAVNSVAAPNAVSIIASGVVLKGFTVRRPYIDETVQPIGQNTILIGGLYQDYGLNGETLPGFRGNTVTGCVLGGGDRQSVNGVTIWHSADNVIAGNTIKEPMKEAINIYDGWSNAGVSLPWPSKGNRVYSNRVIPGPISLSDQAVFVGAWHEGGQEPYNWTDNSGTLVYRNDCGGMGLFTAYSRGKKEFSGNTNVGWTGYCQASGYIFRGGPTPQEKCEQLSGASKVQAGPPP